MNTIKLDCAFCGCEANGKFTLSFELFGSDTLAIERGICASKNCLLFLRDMCRKIERIETKEDDDYEEMTVKRFEVLHNFLREIKK